MWAKLSKNKVSIIQIQTFHSLLLIWNPSAVPNLFFRHFAHIVRFERPRVRKRETKVFEGVFKPLAWGSLRSTPRRQRKRHIFAYLITKNNSFARSARAVFIFVHFFHVFGKSATWNDQFSSFKPRLHGRFFARAGDAIFSNFVASPARHENCTCSHPWTGDATGEKIARKSRQS